MKVAIKNIGLLLVVCLLAILPTVGIAAGAVENKEAEPDKGPNNGLMLREGNFVVELAIFETGVPPEYRAWITDDGKAVDPEVVELEVVLTRLGGVRDEIGFTVQESFLRGDMEIYEPHSFKVTVTAQYQGKNYQWQYDSFEGRTTIDQEVADSMGVVTEVAGPALLHETISAYGKLKLPPSGKRELRARFTGQIVRVHKKLGDTVSRGDILFTIESNDSLRSYSLRAPMPGVIAFMDGGAGEATGERILAVIVDIEQTQAEVAVYPLDRQRVKEGNRVILKQAGGKTPVSGEVIFIEPMAVSGQSQNVLIKLDKLPLGWKPGQFVAAEIEVAKHPVDLAVKRIGLQGFRDFTVVFAKVGQQYEVRMLELGRQDKEWVEVLGGLKPGTEYVSENSFLLKADVEKSGASHDH